MKTLANKAHGAVRMLKKELNPVYHLKRQKFMFPHVKKSYYSKIVADPSLTTHKSEIEALLRDGALVVEDFITAEVVEQIKNEVMPSMEKVWKGEYTGPNKHYQFPEYGVYRLLEIDKISPASSVFFESEMINTLAQAFVTKDVKSYQRMAELKPEPGNFSISDDYHFDDWKHRFKAFLYLTDVTEDEAPLRYVKGTHLPNEWRAEKDYEYHVSGHKEGYYTVEEAQQIMKDNGFEETILTGKAGTLILADVRGLHRGTPLKKNNRLILVNFFGVR